MTLNPEGQQAELSSMMHYCLFFLTAEAKYTAYRTWDDVLRRLLVRPSDL